MSRCSSHIEAFESFNFDLTSEPKYFEVTWGGSGDFEHTEYDCWFNPIRELDSES